MPTAFAVVGVSGESPFAGQTFCERGAILSSMYAFLPFPAAIKAMTRRRQACNASMDGSSMSSSSLARIAYSSLSFTAA